MTRPYEVEIDGHKYQFTAHETIAEARLVLHPSHRPIIVRLANGWYDAYPAGCSFLPKETKIVERYVDGKFVPVNKK